MPSLTRAVLVATSLLVVGVVGVGVARADEVDTCANAYENAQRHHKAGELKASISDAKTCARDVCPEILKKDCSAWVTTWSAEEKSAEPKAKPSPTPPPAPAPIKTEEPSRPVPTMTWVLGGVGVLALGGATASFLIGMNTRRDLDAQGCAARGDCNGDAVDRARTSFLVADIFGIAGLAAIGGAIVIYATRPDANGATSAKTSVAIIPSSGGASLRATF